MGRGQGAGEVLRVGWIFADFITENDQMVRDMYVQIIFRNTNCHHLANLLPIVIILNAKLSLKVII